MSNKTRKTYTAEEKVGILRRYPIDHVPISDLCDEYGFHPTRFYRWQRQLFENATAMFASPSTSATATLERRIATPEAKLAHKHEVLFEVMEEYVRLKKELGEL